VLFNKYKKTEILAGKKLVYESHTNLKELSKRLNFLSLLFLRK